MIRWARERAGLSIDEVAEKLKVSNEKVVQWENGEMPISMQPAEKLAKLALIPFGVLFADDPPEVKLPIPDFRTQSAEYIAEPSPELLETINDAKEKQDWYRDYLLSERHEHLNFVGEESIKNDPAKVAKNIYQILNLHDGWRKGNWEGTLSLLIDKTEDAGIIVLRNSIVRTNTHRPLDVEEFRGFILNDDIAPLVFINGKDAKSAQMFTLIHEITHVLLGQSALIDADMNPGTHAHRIERFCNQVAAEFLTPRKDFTQQWNNDRSVDDNIDILSRYFKVSHLVCISRSFQLNYIDWPTRERLWEREIEDIKSRKKDNDGGNFHESHKFRIGRLIAQAVISEVQSNRMLFRDAFHLLGVKSVKTLQSFSEIIGIMA